MLRRLGPVLLAASLVTTIVVAESPASADLADEYTPGSCITNTVQTTPFVDVPAGQFYTNPVGWAYLNEIVQGTEATRYSPLDPVNRAQFAAMLHRMLCRPAATDEAPFPDVVPGSFYDEAVDWLWSEGLTTGKPAAGGNVYDPGGSLTRGELAAFLFRLVGTPDGAPVNPFADVDRSRFFAEPIDWLFWREITTGTTSTTFSPNDTVTRAQVITFLYRLNIGAAGLIDPATIELGFATVQSGLARPVGAAVHPVDGSVFLIEQRGGVHRIPGAGDGTPDWDAPREFVLDLSSVVSQSGNERGLLGVAISPDGGRIYFSGTDRVDHDSIVWEFDLDGDGPIEGSERVLIEVDQPSQFTNHNGGHIVFGPDDRLYASFGDGGGSGDPLENGQDTTNLLGAIIRIDPVGDGTYTIPADNPFGGGVAPEIYLYGVRNPWKFSFDSSTGDFWVADVGQNRREEINRLRSSDGRGLGANLGWNTYEGTLRFDLGDPEIPGRVTPVYDYVTDGPEGQSVTGGVVYRGTEIVGLDGTYLWADYVQAELRGFNDTFGSGPIWYGVEPVGGLVSAFFADNTGEVYVVSLSGTVSKIVAT
ncbi:MAG: PQQ-dependent sugar dehydrogenase [Actinomycetota bacterium]